MRLLIPKFIGILFSAIFILSCSEEKSVLISNSPPELPELNYKLNLRNPDSGQNLNSATITWTAPDGSIALTDLSTGSPISTSGASHAFSGLQPGEFRDIQISATNQGIVYTDTIQVFTRPVYPVTNFELKVTLIKEGNGEWDEGEYFNDANEDGTWNPGESFTDKKEKKYKRTLNWSTTKEPSENSLKYTLYRVENENADNLINPENCNCKIATLSVTDINYIDSTVQEISGDFSFFYQLQVSTGTYKRNSFIDNYTNFPTPGKINLTENNVSTNKIDYIRIDWEITSNTNHFYQYEIWRAPDEELSDTSLIAIIPNPQIDHFLDYSAGNGTTWYYSVATIDVGGGHQFSNFVSGWSLP